MLRTAALTFLEKCPGLRTTKANTLVRDHGADALSHVATLNPIEIGSLMFQCPTDPVTAGELEDRLRAVFPDEMQHVVHICALMLSELIRLMDELAHDQAAS